MNTRKITPAVGMLLLLVPIGIVALVLFTRSGLGDYGSNIPDSSKPTPRGPEAAQTVRASEPTLSAEDQEKLRNSMLSRSFYELPGKVIAAGKNTIPKGRTGLLTYRVEEVTLPQTSIYKTYEKTYTLDKVWRIIITAEKPFVVGAMPLMIGIDRTSIEALPGVKTLTTIVFDPSILKEGAPISVSPLGPAEESVLSETLHLDLSPGGK